jgi:hypothetical protein
MSKDICPHCGKDTRAICKWCEWYRNSTCQNDQSDRYWFLIDEDTPKCDGFELCMEKDS